jgi:hypothetical protein
LGHGKSADGRDPLISHAQKALLGPEFPAEMTD